jgi:hypothetical protein
LRQIARAVQETTNFGVIYAFLTCHNYDKQWERKHGYFRKNTLREFMEKKKFMWAIAVKSEYGMQKLDSQIIEWMDRYRASADTWLLPPKLAMYLRLVPAENTYYYLRGQRGPDGVDNVVTAGRPHESNQKRLHDIVEPFAIFQKNRVFLTRTYHVERTGPIDMMTQQAQIGEYTHMVNDMADCDYANGNYKSCYLNRRFYDEDNDRGFTAGPEYAVRNGMLFDEDGNPRAVPDSVNAADANDLNKVFFLRPIQDAMGATRYAPIEYCGDIDNRFFGSNALGNLAQSVVSSLGSLVTDQIRAALAAGMNEIKTRASARLVDAGGNLIGAAGRTRWAALIAEPAQDPEGTIGQFVTAVQTLATVLSNHLGGSDNLFLDPANAIGGGDGTQANTLYDNLLNYRAVPVFERGTAATIGVNDANQQARTNMIGIMKEAISAGASELRTLANDIDDATATEQDYQDLRAAMIANPQNTTLGSGQSVGDLTVWLGRLDQMYRSSSARVPQAGGRSVSGGSMSVELAVYPNNPSFVDGTSQQAGYTLASRFDLTQPASGGYVVDDTGAVTNSFTLVGNFCSLEEMPVMRGVEAAIAQRRMAPRRSAYGAPARDQVDDIFAPLTSFASEPVGEMEDIDDGSIRARRTWIPQAGGQVPAEGVRLRFGNMAYNLDQLNRTALQPEAKLAAAAYLGAPWRRQTFDGFVRNNIPLPFGALYARPHATYDMALGIKAQAGGETGYTYFGHSDFQLADDAALKIHYGNYTHYGKSVIHNEKNVFVAYNIFPNAALGGLGVRPYTSPEQYDPESNTRMADVFVLIVPYEEKQFPSPMSISGRFYTYMDEGMLNAEDPANRKLHYTTAAYYNRIWKWYNPMRAFVEFDEPMYRMNAPVYNYEMWQGAQGSYNPRSAGYDRNIIRNQSPWGGDVAEGCKSVRNGGMDRLKVVPVGTLGF